MQDMAGTPARPIVGQVGSRHEDAMLHPCRAIFTPPPPPIEGSKFASMRRAFHSLFKKGPVRLQSGEGALGNWFHTEASGTSDHVHVSTPHPWKARPCVPGQATPTPACGTCQAECQADCCVIRW